jgi:hypothetical protein
LHDSKIQCFNGTLYFSLFFLFSISLIIFFAIFFKIFLLCFLLFLCPFELHLLDEFLLMWKKSKFCIFFFNFNSMLCFSYVFWRFPHSFVSTKYFHICTLVFHFF